MSRRTHAGQAGFTLLEIMLVVVIIGILVGAAGVAVKGRTQQARRVKAQNDIAAISSALGMYELDNGILPSDAQGLQALITKPAGSPQPVSWNGPYLANGYLPKDPWGRDYQYVSPESSGTGTYIVRSLGPNESDPNDDILNVPATPGGG